MEWVKAHWQEYDYILHLDLDVDILHNPVNFMHGLAEYDIFVGSGSCSFP